MLGTQIFEDKIYRLPLFSLAGTQGVAEGFQENKGKIPVAYSHVSGTSPLSDKGRKLHLPEQTQSLGLGLSLWKHVQKASLVVSQSEFPEMEQLKEQKLFGLEETELGGG